MFNKLFRPKWQHRKVHVRLSALRELEPSDPILLQVARNDSEASVRQQAVRLIGDPLSLFQLLEAEGDAAVRELCSKRLRRLLAGQEQNLPLQQRLDLLGGCVDEAITAYVLQHALEVELRRAALGVTARASLLAEVALHDPSAELRLAAVERIERPATLERIAREARGKDKQVARRAKEKLEAERTEQLRPQRQAAICEAVEALAGHGGVDLVSFRRLAEEWQALLPPADAALGVRYERASAAFAEAHERVRAEAAIVARQRELCERIEQLLHGLEQDEADTNGVDSAITMLQRAWETLEGELPAINPGLRERFNDALEQATRRRAGQLRQREELAALQKRLSQLEQLLEQGEPPGAETLQRLESEWQAAGGGRKQAHTAALSERFSSLLQQAQGGLAEQAQTVEALQQEYSVLLGQMESALGEGQIRKASACRDKLGDREKRLAALGSRPSLQQQRRRKVANARLRELHDWRRFGTDQAREELLERMRELQASPLEPLKQAEAIKTLKENWRELDRKDGLAADSLWQAFEQTAEAAYAPCRDYYLEQARLREQNLEARRRFIAELEREHDAVDWHQPDWAALEQRLQQAQKLWPRLGGVERNDWEELNARFKLCLAAFESHLSARRESEKQRREALISRVEALAGEPDLEQALAVTREAQGTWRPDVCCPQRVEQALWRRFKAACDAVYERQKSRAAEQRRLEKARSVHMRQLCEQAEALVAEAQEQPEPARSRLAELQQQWRDAAAGPRRDKALQQRFDAAMAAFRQAEEASRRRRAAAGLELLREKAALCEALERELFAPAQSATVEQLAAAWQKLEALPDVRLEQALTARFDAALGPLRGERASDAAGLQGTAADNLERRLALCLQLELLAGVESPPQFAEQRLALQVQLLAGAMTGQLSEAERQERKRQLLEEYFTIGPVPPDQVPALQSRIDAVLAGKGERGVKGEG
jgi:hypothetical protein